MQTLDLTHQLTPIYATKETRVPSNETSQAATRDFCRHSLSALPGEYRMILIGGEQLDY
jgi:hypothetical protein